MDFKRSQFGFLFAIAFSAVVMAAQTTPVVVNQPVECATSIDGSVVGTGNPLDPPVTAAVYSGTLGSGNYYVEVAWVDASGNVTLVSPEKQIQLTATGSIHVSQPSSGAPATAVSMRVYIGTISETETLQGTATPPSASFIQSTPLTLGAAVPPNNTTLCQVVANDAGWPTGTGYDVSLTSPSGDVLPGYPMQWQLLGPGQTIFLNKGLPRYNGQVDYPIPILAQPYNHAAQSISGPLSMSGYNLTNVGYLGTGTSIPAWGIDAEVSPNNTREGVINSQLGYLINGSGGTAGEALCSDGTYFDTICAIPVIPMIYYQTIDANGTAKTQRPILNFSSNFAVTDSGSPAETNVDLGAAGTAGTYTNPASITTDVYGRVTEIIPSSMSWTLKDCMSVACAAGSTYTTSETYTNSTPNWLDEFVSMQGWDPSAGCTGPSGLLTGYVNSSAILYTEINNDCNTANVSGFDLRVPPGATFKATIACATSCSDAYLLYSWNEIEN